MKPSRALLAGTAGLFAVSLVSALWLFPGQVGFWYAPADRPDVTVSATHAVVWLAVGYLFLTAVAALVAGTLAQLAAAFSGRGRRRGAAPWWVASGLLALGSVHVWLVATVGNDPERAWYELGLQLLFVATLVGTVAVRVARASRRLPTVRPEDEP